MQYNLQQKNKSRILRSTEEAKRKSRHRLLGSIFLLVIALVILLDITAKVKPSIVDPKLLEIQKIDEVQPKLNASASTINKYNSGISSHIIHQESINVDTNISRQLVKNPKSLLTLDNQIINNNEKNNNALKESIATDEHELNSKEKNLSNQSSKITKHTSNSNYLSLSPKVIVEKIKSKLSPSQILNGKYAEIKNKYYIQFITTDNKSKLLNLQKELSQKGVKTFIQTTKTSANTSFQLRAGPFRTSNEANEKLKQLLDNH